MRTEKQTSICRSQNSFKLRDKAALEFRTEIFNVFNFLNFVGAPGRIAFTPNFGRLFNAGPSRQVQFGLKLMF
jgi:hypothetical protein